MTQFNFFEHTHIMGIINVTPDSFSGDGILNGRAVIDNAVEQAHYFIEAGCHILDIGAESTRPGATLLSAHEEIDRLIPVIDVIRRNFDIPISVDTTKASVARVAFEHGATIINDVSGLMGDRTMIDLAVERQCYTVIMHSNAHPFMNDHAKKTMLNVEQTHLGGRYVTDSIQNDMHEFLHDVRDDLEKRANWAIEQGLSTDKIILDVGNGFGKTIDQNLALVANHDYFKTLPFPFLLGVSRKSFIGYAVNAPVNQRLAGSIAALTVGVLNGANIVRVHDVYASVQAARLVDMVRASKLND